MRTLPLLRVTLVYDLDRSWTVPGLRSRPWASACLLLGAALLPATPAAFAAKAPFVDLIDHPTAEANWDRFFALEDRLADAFRAECAAGDCAARYGVLLPLQLRCSVRTADRTVAVCIWVIAGSGLQVQATGRIDPDLVVWRCALPLPRSRGIGVEAFHAALERADPLSARLPGARSTLRHALRKCLAGTRHAS
ncbi:hypothetical protein [Xanthomonas sp. 60]